MKPGNAMLTDLPDTARYISVDVARDLGGKKSNFFARLFADNDDMFGTDAGATAFRAFGDKDLPVVEPFNPVGEDYRSLYDLQDDAHIVWVSHKLAEAHQEKRPGHITVTPNGRRIYRFGVHLFRATVLWALKQKKQIFSNADTYLGNLEFRHYGGIVK
jgi:hypothetical protein